MGITNLTMKFVQQNGEPRLGRLVSTDTLATIEGAGYINNYVKTNNIAIYSSDFVAVVGSDGNKWCYPSINAGTGVITLTPI